MWCLSCTELAKCPAATGDMVVDGLGCTKWTEVSEPVREAREELIMTLGPHSILANPNPKKTLNEKGVTIMSSDENRSKLRLIAIKSGLLQKIELAKSLRWSEEQLLERLEGTFEDCRKWSSEEIDSVISDLGSGKKRQPSKTAKKPTPAAKEEESSEKVEKAKETKRQPAKKRRRRKEPEAPAKAAEASKVPETSEEGTSAKEEPKKRQPARRKRRQSTSGDSPAVFQVDGKQLIEEFGLADVKDQVISNQNLLAGLTVEAVDTKKNLEDLKKDLHTFGKRQTIISKQLESISKFCTWFYNEEVGEDDSIEHLTDVFK